MNYEDRHPQSTRNNIPWDHPIRSIMRAVCNMPDRSYNPDDPELLLIGYDELLAVLEDHIGDVPAKTEGDVADPYCELDSKREYEDAMLRPIVEARDAVRAKVSGTEMRKEPQPLRPDYIEQMRAHVDEGGQLSHRNGIDLLAEVERLQKVQAKAAA